MGPYSRRAGPQPKRLLIFRLTIMTDVMAAETCTPDRLVLHPVSLPRIARSMKWPNADAIGLLGSSCQALASKATIRRRCLTRATLAPAGLLIGFGFFDPREPFLSTD